MVRPITPPSSPAASLSSADGMTCFGKCNEILEKDESYLKKHDRHDLKKIFCESCWEDEYGEKPGSLFSVAALYPKIGTKTTPALETTITISRVGESLGVFFDSQSCKISRVSVGQPGHRAGLEVGMRILTVDDFPVFNIGDIKKICKLLIYFKVTVDVSQTVRHNPVVEKQPTVTIDIKRSVLYCYPGNRKKPLSTPFEANTHLACDPLATGPSFDADLLSMVDKDIEPDCKIELTDINLKSLTELDKVKKSSSKSSISNSSKSHKNPFMSITEASKSGTYTSQGDCSSAGFSSSNSVCNDVSAAEGIDDVLNDGITLSGNLITAVASNSKAEKFGITTGMQLVTQSGSDDIYIAAGGQNRHEGRIIRSNRESNWGLISLEKPIFLKKGTLGRVVKSDSVFCGDVAFSSKEMTGCNIIIGDRVQFSLRMRSNKTLSAINVLPAPGAFSLKSANGFVGFEEAIRNHANQTRTSTKQICMSFIHGKCSKDVTKCNSGIHVSCTTLKYPLTEPHEVPHKIDFTTIPFKALTTVDLFRQISISFSSKDGKSLFFTENGSSTESFNTIIVTDDGNLLKIPEIKRCLKIPSADRIRILGELSSLCRFVGVAHNIEPYIIVSVPPPRTTFEEVDSHTLKLIRAQWHSRTHSSIDEWGEYYSLNPVRAWACHHKSLDFKLHATQFNMKQKYNSPDLGFADCYHGTAEANILAISQNGFDTSKRCGQALGPGEYFAVNPGVSQGYCRGGRFMLQCSVLLGKENEDYTFHKDYGYYVVKHSDGNVQAVPKFIIQYEIENYECYSAPCEKLRAKLGVKMPTPGMKVVASKISNHPPSLKITTEKFSNGDRRAFMSAPTTLRLRMCWLQTDRSDSVILSWIDSFLCEFSFKSDDVHILRHQRRFQQRGADNKKMKSTIPMVSICVEVSKKTPVSQLQLGMLNFKEFGEKRRYISVCDAQEDNDWISPVTCPSWTQFGCCGSTSINSSYWWLQCPFRHPPIDVVAFKCTSGFVTSDVDPPFKISKLLKGSKKVVTRRVTHRNSHFSDYNQYLKESIAPPTISTHNMWYPVVDGDAAHPSFPEDACYISLYSSPELAYSSLTIGKTAVLVYCKVLMGHTLDLSSGFVKEKLSLCKDFIGIRDCYDSVTLPRGEVAVFSPHQIQTEWEATLSM